MATVLGVRFFLALILVGCSSPSNNDPVTCEPTDRSGSYWAEFKTLSGDCGPQNASLVQLGGSGSSDCVEESPARWSDADCTLETKGTCPVDGVPGAYVTTTAITTQQDSAGDVIDGTITLTLKQGGSILCNGSYSVHMVRQ
jgi:hypothetical protein